MKNNLDNKKIEDAKKKLEDIEKKISPFIKKKEIINRSSQGRWQIGSVIVEKECKSIYC